MKVTTIALAIYFVFIPICRDCSVGQSILQCTANISRISRSINYNLQQQQMFQDNAKKIIDLLSVSVSLSLSLSLFIALLSFVSFSPFFALRISPSRDTTKSASKWCTKKPSELLLQFPVRGLLSRIIEIAFAFLNPSLTKVYQ